MPKLPTAFSRRGRKQLPPPPSRKPPKVSPRAEAAAEPVVEAKPVVVETPAPAPKPIPTPKPTPAPVVEAKPEPVPEPEPVVEEPEPVVEEPEDEPEWNMTMLKPQLVAIADSKGIDTDGMTKAEIIAALDATVEG